MTPTPTDTPPKAAALDLERLEADLDEGGYPANISTTDAYALIAEVRAARQHAAPQGEPEPVAGRLAEEARALMTWSGDLLPPPPTEASGSARPASPGVRDA